MLASLTREVNKRPAGRHRRAAPLCRHLESGAPRRGSGRARPEESPLEPSARRRRPPPPPLGAGEEVTSGSVRVVVQAARGVVPAPHTAAHGWFGSVRFVSAARVARRLRLLPRRGAAWRGVASPSRPSLLHLVSSSATLHPCRGLLPSGFCRHAPLLPCSPFAPFVLAPIVGFLFGPLAFSLISLRISFCAGSPPSLRPCLFLCIFDCFQLLSLACVASSPSFSSRSSSSSSSTLTSSSLPRLLPWLLLCSLPPFSHFSLLSLCSSCILSCASSRVTMHPCITPPPPYTHVCVSRELV